MTTVITIDLSPAIAQHYSPEDILEASRWLAVRPDIPTADAGPRIFADPFSAKVNQVLKSFAERGKVWRPEAPRTGVREEPAEADLEVVSESNAAICPWEMRVYIEAAAVARTRVRTSSKKDKAARPRRASAPRAPDPAQMRKLDKGLHVILDREPYFLPDGTANQHRCEIIEIVNRAQAGVKNPEIARELGISLRKVERRLAEVRRAAGTEQKGGGV